MTIEGLENSTYYVYNPIWVKVSDLTQVLIINIVYNGESFIFKLEPIGGEVTFDIAKSIRGILPSLTNKTSIPTEGSVDGVYKVGVQFILVGVDIVTLNKYFMIGGKDSFESNLSPGANLSLSNYYWQGWPAWTSVYANNKVTNVALGEFITPKSTEILYPRHDCESIFLAFRNLKGGFSFYLFEDFQFDKANKDMGFYLIKQTIKDSGSETKVILNVRTKAIRELYETLEHLAQSEEIYYRTKDVDEYVRISGTNDIKFNYKNKTTDVQFSFEVVTNTVKSR